MSSNNPENPQSAPGARFNYVQFLAGCVEALERIAAKRIKYGGEGYSILAANTLVNAYGNLGSLTPHQVTEIIGSPESPAQIRARYDKYYEKYGVERPPGIENMYAELAYDPRNRQK